MIEKSQKTSTNQSTKFNQLKAYFGHQEINNCVQNNIISVSPKNGTPNGSLENIHLNFTEIEVKNLLKIISMMTKF